MEHPTLSNQSRVPRHLQYFHRPALIAEPRRTTAALPDVCQSLGQSRKVELCPPHWRLPPKQSVREKLKSILLKEWPKSHLLSSPPRPSPRARPAIMRMKDSDDYITARAANPRTGLISPSIASITPRMGCTPGTPGEALQLVVDQQPPSPTPDTKTRPALRRANEGRKISAGSANRWCADENGWVTTAATLASPKVAQVKADAGLVSSKSHPSIKEDQFIFHMPSDQEPQPYAYPGYSAKQIEAFEHYMCKARRISDEGYDQRVLHGTRQISASGAFGPGVRKMSAGRGSPHLPAGHISVAKRRARVSGEEHRQLEESCYGGAEVNAATFAPFSSPRTPPLRQDEDLATAMKTISPTLKCEIQGSKPMHRKPVALEKPSTIAYDLGVTTPLHDYRSSIASPHAQIHSSPGPRSGDLRHLPRVALVPPTLASVPLAHPLRQPGDASTRKCSLGCTQDAEGDVCVERRLVSSDVPSTAQRTLFDNRPAYSVHETAGPQVQHRHYGTEMHNQQRSSQILEALMTAVVSAIDVFRQMQFPVPRVRVLDVLRADNTTPQQKAAALKTVVSSAGQALAIITATAMLWQVGSAIMHVIEIIFWPMTVPFRILQWLAGAG